MGTIQLKFGFVMNGQRAKWETSGENSIHKPLVFRPECPSLLQGSRQQEEVIAVRTFVLLCFSVAVIEHSGQNQLGQEQVFKLRVHHGEEPSRNPEAELKQRPWRMLPTGLFPMAC